MRKFTLKTIGLFIDVLLHFTPKRYSVETSNIVRTSSPPLESQINGWIYKELHSTDTEFTHRYYYHPGPQKDAPTFLFLHGLIFDGRNFLNISSLSDKWQLIAYNFPESTEYYRGDMNDFRFLLDDLLDNLQIDSFYLCGVSFGGGVATRFAASHSRRIKALVLASTFIMNSSPFHRLRSREMARILLKHPDYKLHWLIQQTLNFAFRGKKNPMRGLKSIVGIKQLNWYRQAVKSITTCEGPEDAERIKCPVLALIGAKDKEVSLRNAKSIKKFIPHAQFEVIEGGTHAMMFLQGEMLADKIRDFCSTIN
jgi:pimeloyl-ACP methyl ester carboxylesterase